MHNTERSTVDGFHIGTNVARQWLIVITAIAQPITIAVMFGNGVDFNERAGGGPATLSNRRITPSQRQSPLFRWLRWAMGSAFRSVTWIATDGQLLECAFMIIFTFYLYDCQ